MRKTEEKAVGTSSEGGGFFWKGGGSWARSGDMKRASELRITIIRG